MAIRFPAPFVLPQDSPRLIMYLWTQHGGQPLCWPSCEGNAGVAGASSEEMQCSWRAEDLWGDSET